MPLLVTSASGANGNGFGALLAFDLDGTFRGTFVDDDRVADPRGLAVDPNENLLFLNSGADRVLAISAQGRVVRDTGWIDGLNPGGGNFGPDGRYFVGLRGTRTIIALATSLDLPAERLLPPGPRWTSENRQFIDRAKPAICPAAETSEFYFVASSVRKSVWTLVRQLRGPHLSTCA